MGTQGQRFICFKMVEMKTRRDRIQNSSTELVFPGGGMFLSL